MIPRGEIRVGPLQAPWRIIIRIPGDRFVLLKTTDTGCGLSDAEQWWQWSPSSRINAVSMLLIFSHLSGMAMLGCPPLWSRLTCLNNGKKDCHEIWYRHSYYPDEESWLGWSTKLTSSSNRRLTFEAFTWISQQLLDGLAWNFIDIHPTDWWSPDLSPQTYFGPNTCETKGPPIGLSCTCC